MIVYKKNSVCSVYLQKYRFTLINMTTQSLILAVLLGSVGQSLAQSCGSSRCSQTYASSCSSDMSCHLYDSCKTSQSSCRRSIGQAPNLKVNCYDTCIQGHRNRPSVPRKCCANSIAYSRTISTTIGQNYLIARLYSPNEPGADVYRSNSFCKYNVQCPSDEYVLNYFVVNFDIEPPDTRGNCLDFLRYHFTATGASVETDACGSLSTLSPVLKSGVHGSGLTLDFRSNRVHTGGNTLISLSCTIPQARVSPGDDQDAGCTPSMDLKRKILKDPNALPPDEDFDDGARPSIRAPRHITVTRKGVVKYRYRTITVMERGRTVHRFRNIKELHVYNRIEGSKRFSTSSRPRNRGFPGYGFLTIGRGYATYNQTIAEPSLLLNDEEENVLRMMYRELLNRGAFDDERFYFTPPKNMEDNDDVDCSINELAQLNRDSCTPALRAAANFFIEKDTSPAASFCQNR